MSAVGFDTARFRSSLNDLHAGIRSNAHQTLIAAVKTAHQAARTTDLFKDGPDAKLRTSITYSIDTAFEGRVRAGARHARFVENGTRPHDIHPRRASALRFQVAGVTFFRKVVHHPGTEARPFMARAAELGEQTLDYGLELMTDAAIAKFNSGE